MDTGDDQTDRDPESSRFDAVVVGAGFAGMYMLHRLRGLGFAVRVYEAGGGVGGTWYWNRYPGARCDTPTLEYSYSFSEELQQEWEWTERYGAQAEIEAYANHVADRFDLRRDIRFDTRVTSATYDEGSRRWLVETDRGDKVSAKYCIMATGGYSVPHTADIKGIETFAGEMYHTAVWPRAEVSFAGKRIGVIGTGASGVQTVGAVAQEDIEHLYVFQRTPNFVIPMRNYALDPEYVRTYKGTYAERRARSRLVAFGGDYEARPDTSPSGPTHAMPEEEFRERAKDALDWGGSRFFLSFPDFQSDPDANRRVAGYLQSMVREQVEDPTVGERLVPTGHTLGARRIARSDDYFPAFNLPTVTLVNLREDPIEEIAATGVRTQRGFYELDMLIVATGFDSGTGSMLKVDITGEHGCTLAAKWAEGPRSYLGVMMEGFPNLFMIAQAGSPGIRSIVIVSIEQHVEWLTELLAYLDEHGVDSIEPTIEAEDAWTAHVADAAAASIFAHDDTQYWGVNVPGKPRAYTSYIGGVGPYRTICDAVRDRGYEGFVLRRGDDAWVSSRSWSGPDASAPVDHGAPSGPRII
jgi:cyclohexanone monooxygenase